MERKECLKRKNARLGTKREGLFYVTEAPTRVFFKKSWLFSAISQNSQQNICVGVFVLSGWLLLLVLLISPFLTDEIINICYWNINACFDCPTKLPEWFHHLNLLCTEFRLVFCCHKKVKYSEGFLELIFFFTKVSIYFFKEDSIIKQLNIISAHLLI